MLPTKEDGNPNWHFMKNISRKEKSSRDRIWKNTIKTDYLICYKSRCTYRCWIERVFFSEIFEENQRGKRLIKSNQIDGSTPYISSTSLNNPLPNNGVDNFIGNKEKIRKSAKDLTLK